LTQRAPKSAQGHCNAAKGDSLRVVGVIEEPQALSALDVSCMALLCSDNGVQHNSIAYAMESDSNHVNQCFDFDQRVLE
jgi:hypothetical protein